MMQIIVRKRIHWFSEESTNEPLDPQAGSKHHQLSTALIIQEFSTIVDDLIEPPTMSPSTTMLTINQPYINHQSTMKKL